MAAIGSSACSCFASEVVEDLLFIAEPDTVLRGIDLESYNVGTGRLVLTNEGYLRWCSFVNQLLPEGRALPSHTLLTGKEFRIELAGEVIAVGHIRTGGESESHAGVNLFDSAVKNSRGRLSLHYWRFEPNMPANPLESAEFLGYFRENGKLIDWTLGR